VRREIKLQNSAKVLLGYDCPINIKTEVEDMTFLRPNVQTKSSSKLADKYL